MCKAKDKVLNLRTLLSLAAAMGLSNVQDATAHQDPPGCSGSGVNMILQARRDLSPVDGVGDTPISAGSTLLHGETIYYRALMRFSGDPACAYESGTVCIDLPRPGVGTCLDVTPVGGFPQIGGLLGVAEVVTKETNYVVNIADVQLAGQLCQGQVRAEARYRNGFFHGETHVSPIDADTPLCNPVVQPCVRITKRCLSATLNAAGQVVVCFSGSISNCGSAVLANISVVNNKPAPNTPVTGIPATLAVGAVANFNGCYTNVGDICGPFPDTVTVTAEAQGFPFAQFPTSRVTDSASDTCTITYQPAIDVTKECLDPVVIGGQPARYRIRVQNTGNIALQNVRLVDDSFTPGNPGDDVTINVPGTLAPGAFFPASGFITNTITTTTAQCGGTGTITNTVVATGNSICPPNQGVTDTDRCNIRVVCPNPKICITKEVACLLPNDTCGPFGKEAVGVKGETQDPAFCYRITVLNCGQEKLVNVTVVDNKLGDLTTNFFGVGVTSGMLATNEMITRFFKMDWDRDMTNIVEAIGVGETSRVRTNALDQAVVRIRQARIMCISQIFVDGVLVPCGSTISDQDNHQVTFRTIVCNNGQAGLANVTITDAVLAGLGCTLPAPFSLAVGACATNDCTITYSCLNLPNGVQYTTTVTAEVDTNQFCAFDIDANRIEVSTQCACSIICVQPEACRVTGGGRQDEPIVCPDADVRYVTHGGQVGAPVGNRVCAIDTTLPNWQLGNPCIHGRWTHVRHMKGGLRGNFHARFFDTLDCACLDTNLTGCQYGAGTKVGELCGDRSTGPLPRPAPANKIAFTGVGDWTCEPGRRRPRACLFRIDIEDRGEPGNAHALDRNGKPNRTPDRYRIRIWVLTEAEEAALRNPADGLLAFRNCISACNGIDYRDGGAVSSNGASCEQNNCNGNICPGEDTSSTGTVTFPGGCPVRTPNIDDGGELLHGNHQIHPAIKNCDPRDPTGPGLAKP